jgi:putative heme iron utilization protein
MLDERAEGDPLEGSRIMVGGTAEEADGELRANLRRRYLNAHPSAESFADFQDFAFFRIRPTNVHLVAGFGRIVDLKPEKILTSLEGADAVLEAEQLAIDHMNADHRDSMNLYATRLLGAKAADWRCTGLDPDGLDMSADKHDALRLDFPRRVVTPEELRGVLKELAEKARATNQP